MTQLISAIAGWAHWRPSYWFCGHVVVCLGCVQYKIFSEVLWNNLQATRPQGQPAVNRYINTAIQLSIAPPIESTNCQSPIILSTNYISIDQPTTNHSPHTQTHIRQNTQGQPHVPSAGDFCQSDWLRCLNNYSTALKIIHLHFANVVGE